LRNAGWRIPLHGLQVQARRASRGIAFPGTRTPRSKAVGGVRALARADPSHPTDPLTEVSCVEWKRACTRLIQASTDTVETFDQPV
jgi:hypothetical protein